MHQIYVSNKKRISMRWPAMLALLFAFFYGSAQTVLLSENFDGATFPSTGWTLTPSGSLTFARLTTSSYPTGITPRSGTYMGQLNSFSVSSGTAVLRSPVFSLTSRCPGQSDTVVFWMYRENGYATTNDSISVFIGTGTTMTGATFLGGTNRNFSGRYPVSSNGWYRYAFAVPPSFNTATNYLFVNGTSYFGNDCYIDDISYTTYAPSNMVVTASHPTTSPIIKCIAAGEQTLMMIRVDTISCTYTPISANTFNLNLTGTTNLSDITSLKLYTTGNSSSFDPLTATQYGSTITNPSSTSISFTGSTNILSGFNYFWLTATTSSGAIANDTLDAGVNTIVFSTKTMSGSNPTGYRVIVQGLSGTYTINPTGSGSSNFTSFANAVSALYTNGLCGPTTFVVSPGTYTEKVTMTGIINGSSAVNTVTFDGVDSTTRILQYNETGTPTNIGVVNFINTQYITFKNMVVKALGTTNSVGFSIQGSNYIRVMNNSISVSLTSTSSYCYGIGQCGTAFTTATIASNNNYENNTIFGGYAGASMYSGAYNTCYNNVFRGNKIWSCYYTGLYTYYQNNDSIFDNMVTFRSGGSSYGMFIYYTNNFHVERNIVNNASYCAYYVYNSGATNTNPTFFNNIGVSSGSYGMYFLYNDNIKCYHNTIYHTGTNYAIYFGYGTNQSVKNNIFHTTGTATYAVYCPSLTGITDFDNNILYAPNSTNFVYWGAAYTSYSALKAATAPYHQKSLNVLANYVNNLTTPYDLHVTNTVAPFIGDATAGVGLDVDKEARCLLAPTIGADESKYNSVAPVAGFTAPDSIFVNSPTTIFNNSPVSDPLQHFWFVDGVAAGSSFNLLRTFPATGTYTIKLRTVGCFGIDSITKIVTVYNATQKPIANFIADNNVVETYVNVNLTDLSTKGPTYWYWTITPSSGVNFTNGTNNLSQNPVVNFANPGLYTICLRDSNAMGMSTATCKTNYIFVRASSNMCIYPFDTRVASGTLYDDGGPAGNYGANHTASNPCTFLIDPCASKVTMVFSEFNLGTGAYLKVYDGKNNTGTPLFTGSGWTGTTIPGGTTGLVANSGKMYIEFITATTLASGFKGTWTSVAGTYTAPAGYISEPDTTYDCGGLFDASFVSTSPSFVKDEANYKWYFDWVNNNAFPDIEGKAYYNAQWSYSTPGTYVVRLDVEGCGGTLTTYDTIVVVTTPSKPVVNFTASVNNASPGDLITLSDLSLYGPTWWRWKITGPGTATTVAGSSTSKTWTVKFATPGVYTVQLKDSNCVGSDSLTKTGYINIVSYCTPAVSTLNVDFAISRVIIGRVDTLINGTVLGLDVTNTTPAPGTVAYRNNTGLTKTYYIGSSSVTKAVEVIASLGSVQTFSIYRPTNYNPENVKIWVDYNQDGTFQASEMVASSGSINGNVFTGSFTVPTTVGTGYTRLRIGSAFSTLSNTPCGANQYGEFNDYRIKITPDQTAPTISFVGGDTVFVEVGRVFTDPGFSVSDNVTNPTPYTVTGIANGTQITKYPFSSSYTVVATDASNNTASRKRYVVATPDVTKPVITLVGSNPAYAEVKTSYADSGATASDFFFGNFTPYISTVSTVNINKLGTYTVTYNVTDSSGNAATTVVRTVVVRDTQKPVITINGGNTINLNVFSPFTVPTAVVTDNYNTGLTYTVTGGPVNPNVVGTYQLFYNAMDSSGNNAVTVTLTVNVRDVIAPKLVLFQKDTFLIDVNSTTVVPEPGYSKSDNYYIEGQLTLVVDYSVVKLNQLGVYSVRYYLSDPSGNVDSSNVRIYKVLDRIAPVMTLNGNSYMMWPRWKPFVDPGVTITDNFYTGLTATADLSKLDIYLPGIYEVKYSVTDGSGNKAKDVTRLVEVYTPTTGINANVKAGMFNVFPNPNNGMVNVTFDIANATNAHLMVYDVNGKLMYENTAVNPMTQQVQIDLTAASKGMYFIKLVTDQYTTSQSFVIEK